MDNEKRRLDRRQNLSSHVRPNAAGNSNDEFSKDTDPNDTDNLAIPEKIRWIFDEAEGDFPDDGEDDSFFDELFLTDDEDDDYGDIGGFLADENDEVGPDASLNEDDLMKLHDMYPDINLATPPPPEMTSGTTKSSISLSSTPVPTNNSAVATTEAEITTESGKTSTATTVSLDTILASLESDLSYFYLRDELGISEDVMWKITNDAPSVLGLKAKNVRNKVQVLQSLVGFTDSEIRQLISSQPTLLQLSVKKNLSPKIVYWIRQLEMGKEDLKALILGCPALLKYSRANINRKLFFFQNTMRYSLRDCRTLLIKNPRLLTCSVKTGLIPRLNFLHKEVEISLPDIRKIVLKNPQTLLMSVEQNLTPKCVFYFIMTLHMDNKSVGKMLLKYPQILNYNLEHCILPIHHYFLSLDFSTYEFSRIIQRYPRLITYSLIHIKRRIGYLRFELSLEAHAIRRILHQSPQVISLGQENIEKTVEFLLQAVAPGASLDGSTNGKMSVDHLDKYAESIEGTKTRDNSDDDLAHANNHDALTIVQILVAGLPTLLALSVENNLKPKVDYLREQLGQEELSNALLRMPALLGYSLDNRIRPRLEKMQKFEIPCQKLTVAITLKDDDFMEWLHRRIQKRTKNMRPTNTSGRGGKSTSRSASKANRGGPLVLMTQDIDQLEEKKSAETDARVTENLSETTERTDRGSNTGNSRVIEEGGKIIHWRRP